MGTSFWAGSLCCLALIVHGGHQGCVAAGAERGISAPRAGAKAEGKVATKVCHYSLDAVLDPARHAFSGTAEIEILGADTSPLALRLNAHFNVTSVREDGSPVAFSRGPAEREAKPLLIQLANRPLGDSRRITIAYEGVIPPPGAEDPDWMGALVIRTNEIRLTEQGKWYPLPGGMRTPMEASIRLPEAFSVIWPGPARKATGQNGQATWKLSVTNPAAPALLAGIYKTVERSRVGVCLFPESAGAANTLLEQASSILSFLESRFGPPPFEPVSLCEMQVLNRRFSYNFAVPGAVVFPTELIRQSQRPDRREFWMRKLAHELAHQWWGCGVELPRDPWPLHDSLAELSAALYLQSWEPDKPVADLLAQEDLQAIRRLSVFARRGSAPSDRDYRQCLAYQKGPRVLAMLRDLMGPEAFDRVLRAYYSQHRFEGTTLENFQANFESCGAIPGRSFFAQWVDRRVLPQLTVQPLPGGELGEPVGLRFQQTEPIFSLPVEVRLTSAAGSTLISCLVTQAQQEIQTRFPGPLLYWEVDPESKLLLETQADTASLIRSLLQAKAAYRRLVEAHQAGQSEPLGRQAQTLRDLFRQFSTALEIDRHRQRLEAAGPLDAKTALQLEEYEALKATLEKFFSRSSPGPELPSLMRDLGKAADAIHHAVRDKQPENVGPAVTQFAELWKQITQKAPSATLFK